MPTISDSVTHAWPRRFRAPHEKITMNPPRAPAPMSWGATKASPTMVGSMIANVVSGKRPHNAAHSTRIPSPSHTGHDDTTLSCDVMRMDVRNNASVGSKKGARLSGRGASTAPTLSPGRSNKESDGGSWP